MRITYKRKQRGIGNVIASMIFIFLLIFMTGNLMVWSILQFSDYQTVVQEMTSYDMLSDGEMISISGARLNESNYLDLTISNTGRSTAHIVSLWIINETSSTPNAKQYYFPQNEYINTGQSLSGIGSSVYLNPTKKYTFRILSELGNIVSYQIIPVSEAIMEVDLTINPPTVIAEHDVFVHMVVTNNLTNIGAVYNLRPINEPFYVVDQPSTTVSCLPPTPSSINTLPSGSTAIFDWLCTINGHAGSNVEFNATYVDAPVGVWNNDTVLIVTGGGRSNSTSYAAVAGDVFMDFKSISWAVRSPRQDTGPFSTWTTDWLINKNDYLVFRMNFTNKGDNNIALAKETAIFFQTLDSNQNYEFYIVNENNGIISTYNDGDITIAIDETVSLYFAVVSPGANPNAAGNSVRVNNAGTYNAIIAIYGLSPNYGQVIPFQAFISV